MNTQFVIEFEDDVPTNPNFNSTFTIEFESGETKVVNVHLNEDDLTVQRIDCKPEEVTEYAKFLRSLKLKVDVKSVRDFLK